MQPMDEVTISIKSMQYDPRNIHIVHEEKKY